MKRIVNAIVERFRRLGIAGHPGLFFCPNIQGYSSFVFGARTGPIMVIDSLFHELAHASEFGGKQFLTRAPEGSFIFNMKEQYILNRMCAVPETWQAVARELRTFAHQYHLMRSAGYKFNREEFVKKNASLMKYMADFCYVPQTASWAREYDERRILTCITHINDLIDTYNPKDSLDRLVDWLDSTKKKIVSPSNIKLDRIIRDYYTVYDSNGSPVYS